MKCVGWLFDNDKSVYFTTGQNANGYKTIKFYISELMMKKLRYNESKSKMNFGYDNDDLRIWYIFLKNEESLKYQSLIKNILHP